MWKTFKYIAKDKGFTLIELMIVVGIIGILVAVAAPNFARYQSKSRQSESKIALAAIYAAEKAFYSEYNAYISSMEAIGYGPEGARRFYNVGWNAIHGAQPMAYDGNNAVANYPSVNVNFTCANNTVDLPANMTGDAQTFIVGASGCIRDNSTNMDRWTMDENKTITNTVISL